MISKQEKNKLLLRAASASVLVALVLIAAKGVAYWKTDSVLLLGSLTDSGLDFFASLISLSALRACLRQPDEKRDCGHIKAEAIAGFVLTAVILAAAVYLGWRAFKQLLDPVVIEDGFFGVAVSVVAILLSISLLAYQKYVIEKTGSQAISADRLHFLGDVMLNIVVIFGLILTTGSGFYAADGIFGFSIAAYVAFSALLVGKSSYDLYRARNNRLGMGE